jgi:hypothetical protein
MAHRSFCAVLCAGLLACGGGDGGNSPQSDEGKTSTSALNDAMTCAQFLEWNDPVESTPETFDQLGEYLRTKGYTGTNAQLTTMGTDPRWDTTEPPGVALYGYCLGGSTDTIGEVIESGILPSN